MFLQIMQNLNCLQMKVIKMENNFSSDWEKECYKGTPFASEKCLPTKVNLNFMKKRKGWGT